MIVRNPCTTRPWTALVLSLLITGPASTVAAHEGEDHTAAEAGKAAWSPEARSAVGTLENYAAAVESKDLSRVKPLFVAGDDFTYFEGTFVNVGWQSYYDHMAPEIALFDKPSYRLTDIRPFVSGDLAYATYAWAMDVTVISDKFEGGRHPISMHGRGTAVLIKQDGALKIRHLHTATAPPPKSASTGPH